jgi:hypothetical protein
MLPMLDKLGGPETDPHYPMGWSMAGNAPLKRWKQDVHHGGDTDPFIVSWPETKPLAPDKDFRFWHIAAFRCAVELSRYRGVVAPSAARAPSDAPKWCPGLVCASGMFPHICMPNIAALWLDLEAIA